MNIHLVRSPAAALLLLAAAACGGPKPPKQPEQCPTGNTAQAIADTMVIRAAPSQGARMGRHLQVWVRMPAERPDFKNLQLFIDGHPVPGLDVRQIGARCALRNGGKIVGYVETYEFMPIRNTLSKDTWAHLLGSPTTDVQAVRVGTGLANGPEFKTSAVRDSTEVAFTVYDKGMLRVVGVVFLVLLVALVWAGIKTTILRDATPVEPRPGPEPDADPAQRANGSTEPDTTTPRSTVPGKPPYSLAKVVMAMWTFLILGGYFGIWLITGDHLGIFTVQALLLLGITGVSTAASVAMTKQKNEPLAADADELRLRGKALRRQMDIRADQLQAARATNNLQQTADLSQEMMALTKEADRVENTLQAVRNEAPGSKNIFVDLISDADGPALYRFQNLIWNVALAIVFIVGTYRALAFPHFDDSLMALLGISEALYLGVKLTAPPKAPHAPNPSPEEGKSRRVSGMLAPRRWKTSGRPARAG